MQCFNRLNYSHGTDDCERFIESKFDAKHFNTVTSTTVFKKNQMVGTLKWIHNIQK